VGSVAKLMLWVRALCSLYALTLTFLCGSCLVVVADLSAVSLKMFNTIIVFVQEFKRTGVS